MSTVSPSPIFVTKQLKEFSHVLMSIDIAKQVEQEDTWGIIARRAIRGITVSDNGSDKGKIDEGSYHSSVSALNVSIEQDFNEAFFKLIIGKEPYIRERPLIGQGNINVDFIESFANIIYGEFFEGVHHTPFNPGGSGCFRPDYPISFSLKSFLSGYK